jgi:pyrroline-5-carboxylate reductase
VADTKRIGVIGCGNMGSVLINGLMESGLYPVSRIYISDVRKESLKRFKSYGLQVVDNRRLSEGADVIIIAVKPNMVEVVLSEIKEFLTPKKVLISIAAGVSTGRIEGLLGDKKIPVIRVMPNVNVKVKSGLLAYCLGRYAGRCEKLIEGLLTPFGVVFKLPESRFDTVTAICGSGPGFIFYVAENIKKICRKKKFTEEQSAAIAGYLIYGSGKMLVETKIPPDTLREMVSSPKGTTVAGLKVFEQKRFPEILKQVVEKSEKRSKELSRV